MRWAGALSIGLVAAVGCGSDPVTPDEPDPEVYTGILPAEDCGPGTMARVGETTCVAVGPTSCPDGFRRASDGWGCEAVLPEGGCTGAQRAALGATACAPVGDCNAPFPPADAYAVAVDATSLDEALASAPSGATIALESGEYDAVTLTKDVTLVGRCPESVIFRGPGQRGIFLQSGLEVTLRSLTVDGFQGGVVASYGPTVSLAQVVLSNNDLGIVAGEATADVRDSVIIGRDEDDQPGAAVSALIGATVTVADVEVRGFETAVSSFDPGSLVRMERSVASYVGPNESSRLVVAYVGAEVEIVDSALHARSGGQIAAGRKLGTPGDDPPPPATVRVTGSELRQTGENRARGLVLVSDDAHVDLDDTTIHHQSYFAVQVGAATLAMRRSVITTDPTFDVYRSGVFATLGATAELDSVAIISAYQNALLAAHPGSRMIIRDSLVQGTEFRGPGPNAEFGGSALAIAAGDGAEIVFERSALDRNQQFAVFAEALARVQITASLIDRNLPADDGGFGEGIVISEDARLSISGSMVRRSADAAIAVAHAAGSVDDTVFLGNGVVVHLDGAALREESAAPEAAPGELLFRDNVLFGNTTFQREGPFFLPSFAGE
jgi:hypothetical protein